MLTSSTHQEISSQPSVLGFCATSLYFIKDLLNHGQLASSNRNQGFSRHRRIHRHFCRQRATEILVGLNNCRQLIRSVSDSFFNGIAFHNQLWQNRARGTIAALRLRLKNKGRLFIYGLLFFEDKLTITPTASKRFAFVHHDAEVTRNEPCLFCKRIAFSNLIVKSKIRFSNPALSQFFF